MKLNLFRDEVDLVWWHVESQAGGWFGWKVHEVHEEHLKPRWESRLRLVVRFERQTHVFSKMSSQSISHLKILD